MEQAGIDRTPERKLAAIMLADIAGFSSLMERDETGTFERVRALRSHLIVPRVAEHGGRIIKTTGDGFLAEFPSATAALQCAIAIQRQGHAQQSPLPEDQRIHMRIGINVGDIIIDGDDVAGDGVVIAARLEPLAPLDGICVSATVREHIRQELGIEYQDLGDQRVKNIARPIRAYTIDLAGVAGIAAAPSRPRTRKISARVALVGLAVVAIAATALFLAAKPRPHASVAASDTRMSFAVIPVGSPPGDGAAAQFSSAVTDALITRQANSPWSRVVSRESVEAAMRSGPSPRDLGRALNVRYIVRGDATRDADRFNVHLAVINADTEQVLGTREFSWPLARPINVHRRELDNAIGYLAGRGYRLEVEQVKKKRPEELDARDLAYLANDAWKSDRESYEKLMPLLRRALELSPDDRLALLLLAKFNLCECRKSWSAAPEEQEKIGADALDRYITKYGDYRPIVIQKIGLYEMHSRFDDALVLYERLLEKSAGDPEILAGMAFDLMKLDKAKEGLVLVERALQEDPSAENRALAAAIHFKLGSYRQSADLARKAIAEMTKESRSDPWSGGILLVRAAAEALDGRMAEAKGALQDFHAIVPGVDSVSAFAKWQDPRADLAGDPRFYEGLRKAGLRP